MPRISLNKAYQVLVRKKPFEDATETKLSRVLTTFDLTSLGIGATLGVGVYVLAGEVSKNNAGPAVVISFLIAAITSIFAGFCYAEFGARIPTTGSAYIYSYVSIGEFVAFLMGWNLIVEYIIGSASVAKAISTYLDSMCNKQISHYLLKNVPMTIEGLSDFPDGLALIIALVFTWAIAFGAKKSTILNSIFTVLNISVVIFVIIAGAFKASTENWAIPHEEVPKGYGNGGFMPYGVSGIVKGAAICFFGFIGFDAIATAGEEARNPKRSIPFSLITSLTLTFVAYLGISIVLTMMLPYFEQDEKAPLPYVFQKFGWHFAEYIVSAGALCGLCASLMGAMFPLARIIFAMAKDGLLFKFLRGIHPKYKTPFTGTLLSGILTAIFAAILNLNQLVKMNSIQVLLAYTIVASCVLILRYECDEKFFVNAGNGHTIPGCCEQSNCFFLKTLLNTKGNVMPTKTTSMIVTITTTVYGVFCIWLSLVLTKFEEHFENITIFDVIHLVSVSFALIVSLYIIARQPSSSFQLSFKVPFVPWLPGLSIFINIYLMIKLDRLTWIYFSIGILLGVIIYFSYSIRHSALRKKRIQSTSSLHSEETRGKFQYLDSEITLLDATNTNLKAVNEIR